MGKVQRIAVVFREDKKEVLRLAEHIRAWAKARGLQVLRRDLSKVDLVIALGGDGTYLEAVRQLERRRVPVVGANFGHLGFLTETQGDELLETVEAYVTGKLKASSRSMLAYTLKKDRKKVAEGLSLNDVVIERGGFTHLIEMRVRAGREPMMQLRADGLIVATPTGSTAYNLSAGGPILHPTVPAIVVTPLCPHSLTDRSITLPDTETITIQLLRKKQKANMMADGQPISELTDRHVLEIRRAPKDHLLLAPPSFNFLARLNQKLKFGDR